VGHVSGFLVELRFGMCCAWCLGTVQVTLLLFVEKEFFFFLNSLLGQKIFLCMIFVCKVDFQNVLL